MKVDGIVYLGESGVRKVNFLHLFADLCLLLPDDIAEKLKQLYKDPHISTADKMRELLSAFLQGRVVVLLDNFENKLNPETHDIADEELDEALKALLNFQHHAVTIIITTRITPQRLALVQPGRQYRLDLDEGLRSPFAENILREMDRDGKVGLKSAQKINKDPGYMKNLLRLFDEMATADKEGVLTEVREYLVERSIKSVQ